jgi:hypothetical protein
MTHFSPHRASLISAVAIALALVVTPLLCAQVTLPIRMRAFAVNMSANLTGANGILEITIDQWSSEQERADLLATVPKGQETLLASLGGLPVKGRIRIPGWAGPDPQNYRLGWNLRYAWHEMMPDGGERIVVATDRQMSFQEVRNQPRTAQYPFLLIQIQLAKDGTSGEGKMASFAQITFDKKKNVMVIENYGTEPVRLNQISVEKK